MTQTGGQDLDSGMYMTFGRGAAQFQMVSFAAGAGDNVTVTVDGTPWKNPLVGRESIQITRKPKDRPNIDITADPIRGVKNADYLYTDVWVSMGEDEGKLNDRLNALKPFQLNGELYRQAKPGAKVMHCLPAHRGEEITDEVMEWNETSSAIWRQAENRLHAQKALLITLLK